MRRSFFILALLLHSLQNVYAQSEILNRMVSIDIEEGTTGEILEKISTKGDFFFSYGQEIDNSRYVQLSSAEQSVKAFLEEIIGTEITCIEYKNKLIVSLKSQSPEFYTIEGTVSDSETKQPIPGVTVFVPDTEPIIGAITDSEGKFRIVVPAFNTAIRLTCIGYESYNLPLGNKVNKDIELSPDNTEINEVRIVYYEKAKEENVNGSVSSISMERLKANSGSLENVLQGNVSGVHVVSNSGLPWASLQVKIRGVNSLINSEPVYYFDGIPIQKTAIYSLSPYDVESVHVYKDGASLAKYGARGGNGVIMLKSKLPNSRETTISFDMYFGHQKVWKNLDLMSAEEFREFNAKYNPNAISSIDSLSETDQTDKIFHAGSLANYHFSVNTGNEKSQFYIGSGYYQHAAAINDLKMERYSFKLNSKHEVHQRIMVSQDLSISLLKLKGLKEGVFMNDFSNPILGALTLPPLETGIGNPLSDENSHIDIRIKNNDEDLNRNRRRIYSLFSNVACDIEILRGIQYSTKIGLGFSYHDNIYFNLSDLLIYKDTEYSYSIYESRYQISDLSFNWQHSLSYSKSFHKDHFVKSQLDFEFEQNKDEWIPKQRFEYDPDLDIRIDSNGANNSDFLKAHNQIDFSRHSLMGLLQYSFKNQLFLNIQVRKDVVSYKSFNDQRKFAGIYPSISTGWIFSKSRILESSYLSYGKIRYGWGKTGNSPQLNYTFFTSMINKLDNLYAFYSYKKAARSSLVRQTNEKFYWENISSHNIGIDLGFFNNKLFIVFDYFISNTAFGQKSPINTKKSLIKDLSLMNSFGIAELPLSRISNKGFDFELSYRKANGRFNWEISTNFSRFRNNVLEVEQLIEPRNVQVISSNSAGNPAFSFVGYKIERLFTAEDCNENGFVLNQPYIVKDGVRIYSQPGAKAGDYKFTDINNDSIIDERDKTMIGNPLPDFTFGLNFNIQYKNIDFSLFWQGAWGNEIFNATKLWFYNPYSISNLSRDVYNSYREEIRDKSTGEVIEEGNTYTNLHRYDPNDINDNLRISDFYIEDGSYLRLKNIQLGYTFNSNFTRKAYIKKMRIFISSQNLFTFTKYSGLDPEVGGWGIDSGIYPQLRTYLLGLNLQF